MATVAVELSDAEAERLEQRAQQLGIKPADLLRAAARELVDEPDESFVDAAVQVLSKNRALYKRLA